MHLFIRDSHHKSEKTRRYARHTRCACTSSIAAECTRFVALWCIFFPEFCTASGGECNWNFAYNCPARNTDQYYLNKVFPQFVRMPGFMGYHTSKRRCATNINKIHFVHFFGRFMPWHDSCHSCLREGGFCSYYNASKCDSIWQLQNLFWNHGDNISSCRLFLRTKFMRCIF